ncbi:bifunctional diaminohydroxyphosphoribosylaminopyrimidine deaminase/5-amino-6-(5-phosphoribosylamino)uracil reductase RibD [Actinotalea sp. M2MS4P-6]|uniref:bifunctional diaminohydroxyphosphoribosylaminopyrimidine deaminase/5-amino-6-(5-phosphoribosylamino)uracil reductase RibD n=1 Tax=Actinotalea sp. M2MS4P-6 TaxID=2983762 RepID=UPI0021E503DF|nr:bifunctional diaminohydroxyphosphoribosylaminopyrimidine deaminase/5-amino-6-(5-phosphoribosylamino)uracil reductase RibD [Actinotalea sp. M2MS4P-6]
MDPRLRARDARPRAVELAARGPAHGPNPQVGAVLLDRDGRVLGEGWHRGAGTAHAEVAALAAARAAGHDVAGATAVVTLEPCDTTGRTGPCTRALLEAGVARVVHAVADPSPAGGGAARLRTAGVEVESGLLDDAVEDQLEVWLTSVRRGTPWVTLKMATTLDGRVAAQDGTSRWITSAESRAHAHGVRARVDAIAVGTGTVLADDPALTVRSAEDRAADHQPLRVVLGDRAVPAGARLRGEGGELVQVPGHDPARAVALLAGRQVRHVLVEGGPTVAAAFLRAGLVDEVHAYLAPALLGDGPAAVGPLGIATIAQALRLRTVDVHRLGPDVLVVARPTQPHLEV